MKKIKILEMIDQSFLGGGQLNLLSLAESLDRSRFQVSVCSRRGGPFIDALREKNIRHFPIDFPLQKKLNRVVIHNICTLLKTNQFDILHTHGGVAGFYGRLAAKRCRIPVIIHTLHGIHYLHYRNVVLKHIYIFLERWFSRFTDGIIFVSDEDREAGIKFRLAPEDKMFIIKNGIDFSRLKFSKSKAEIRRKFETKFKTNLSGPIAGTIARLHHQKGISYLIKAAGMIRDSIPDVKIFIIGGGPLEQKLKEMNRKLEYEGFVRIMGESTEALNWLYLFDVFILPSLWEGLPYVLLEAAALEKPVVASDVEGNRELIEQGRSGMLVPPARPDDLARAVIDLINNPQKASLMGQKLKAKVSHDYTLKAMVSQTQKLYNDLVSCR